MYQSLAAATTAELLEQRAYALIAVLVGMVALAVLLAFLAGRHRRGKVSAELSDLTGSKGGAKSGSDAQHVDDEWWAEQNASDGSPSTHQARWQQALLPPGARPVQPPATPVPSARIAPPPPAPPAPPTHRTGGPEHLPGPPAAPVAAGVRPPISTRPTAPVPATNPVVASPAGANMFSGADEDQSVGDDWFNQMDEEER